MLIERAGSGDDGAREALIRHVYQELRAIAGAAMRKAPDNHTLQPTALVNEAYLRIFDKDASFESRSHFFFVAARAMRDILVEHARGKARLKRGGDQVRVTSTDLSNPETMTPEAMLSLSQALEQLEKDLPRQHDVVMLRFFAGLTNKEVAEMMDLTERTVNRDWRFAKSFLRTTLQETSVD